MCSSEAGYMETRVVAVGQRRPLQPEDLSPLSEEDSVQHVCSTFQQHWSRLEEAHHQEDQFCPHPCCPLSLWQVSARPEAEEELLFPGPSSVRPGFSLLHALWMTFSHRLLQVGLLRMLTDLLELMAPLALRWIILFIENQAVYDWQGRTYVLVLVAVVIGHSLVEQLHEKHSSMTRAKAQVTLTAMLYKKLLLVSRHLHCRPVLTPAHPPAPSPCPSLICPPHLWATAADVDVEKVSGLVVTLPLLLALPARVALCLGLLWRELGLLSTLAGVTVLLLLIPVNSAVRHRATQLKRSQMKARGERESLLMEMLTKIKMLKQLGWEGWFQHRVTTARDQELDSLSVLGYLTTFSTLGSLFVPFLVCVSSFGAFVLLDDVNVLTPSQVFTSICLFRLLRPSLLHLPNLSPTLTQAKCSLCRLENIFRSENGDLDCCHPASPAGEDVHVDHDLTSCSLTEALQRTNLGDPEQLRDVKAETDHPSSSGDSGAGLRRYLQSFGCAWVLLSLVAQLGLVLVSVGQDGLLGVWTSEAKEVQGLEGWTELRDSRVALYVLLGMLQAMVVCAAAHFLAQGSLRASAELHTELLNSTLHLPLTHFQTHTHTTLLLHAFTRDVCVMDEQVAGCLHAWVHSQLCVYAAVFLLSVVTPVYILAAGPPLILLFRLQSQYTPVSRRMEHLEKASRLSVKALFREMPPGDRGDGGGHGNRDAEALHPASLYEDRSLSHCHQVLHHYLLCHFNRTIMDRWVTLRLDAILSLLVFLVTLILLDNTDALDSGTVGLALLYALSMRGVFHQWRAASSDVHDCVRAVRNIAEYSALEKEGPWTLPHRVPPGWPQWGEIELRSPESTPSSSDDHNPALRGVSFHIQRGEKVSVLSGDAADAEALVCCLLRTLEGASGTLLIDGVDVAGLGLHDLRRRINLIPQVPVLFSGSLRANLDPARRLPDAQVWLALELCHLKPAVQELPGKLLHQVTDRGHISLSEGQRRLLCVARALLWPSRVLVVEEPLAPVEPETEHLLQHLIHTEFSSCTVLTLTQNPHTIMDSDRVLVLDKGRLLDFDTPTNVLQRNAALLAARHRQRRL
ncbi:ATP-binding cassette sub-family C member 3 [Engraulis encrasicolus]|uniref:ATP-binding cassette sub-family C member 3 n=1 Tax=Engraulis encrasicolus TaxID=184585 RepID=UPI002FCFA8AA